MRPTPCQNERDLEDVPPELLDSIEIAPVDTAEEVLDRALEPPMPERTGKGKASSKSSRAEGATGKTATGKAAAKAPGK